VGVKAVFVLVFVFVLVLVLVFAFVVPEFQSTSEVRVRFLPPRRRINGMAIKAAVPAAATNAVMANTSISLGFYFCYCCWQQQQQ
jgi:type II secretory pathway component PulF